MEIKNFEPETGIELGTYKSTVHYCPLPYSLLHGVGTSKLKKKLKGYNCKGDKSVPPHAD